MPHIGRVDLSRNTPPKIIVSFTGTDNPAPARDMDIAELRLDTLEDVQPDAVKDYIRRVREQLPDTPLLGTIRMRAEFGHWYGAEEQRLELFQEITPLVDAIDVELYAGFTSDVYDLVLQHRKGLIVSWHYTEAERPTMKARDLPPPELPRELLRMYARPGTWRKSLTHKIVTPTPCLRDVTLLLNWLHKKNEKEPPSSSWIIMGMGRQGPLSRIMAATLGSVAVYAYPTHSSVGAVAAGQMSLESTRRYLDIVQSGASIREGLHQCIRRMHKDGMHTPEDSLEETLRWVDQQPGVEQSRGRFFSPSMLLA